LAGSATMALRILRSRDLDTWLMPYLMQCRRRRSPRSDEEVHLLLCIADHFEPHNGRASDEQADRRVQCWLRDYPRRFEQFCDSDGRPPQHTFFYPLEQYCQRHVEALARLCDAGFGEVEVHLHHDHDTAESLRRRLREYTEMLADRHGLLSRDRQSGHIAYGFVHGNWALDNSRPDGRWCGVNNELDVLRQTGCYADFTLPSCPSATQTRKINSIYYAKDDSTKPKSHDGGQDVGDGPAPGDALMLIQGPLLLDWTHRKGGLLPRIENGCIQATQPPSPHRLDLWLRARVHVQQRPDWLFVKLYTHGAPESNQAVVFGEAMLELHRELARRAHRNPNFHFHYVTAREMHNLALAAESGWRGSVQDAREFRFERNRPCVRGGELSQDCVAIASC
jgi:hypothetical protein